MHTAKLYMKYATDRVENALTPDNKLEFFEKLLFLFDHFSAIFIFLPFELPSHR